MATSETTTRVLFGLVGALAAALIAVLVVMITDGDDEPPAPAAGVSQPAGEPSRDVSDAPVASLVPDASVVPDVSVTPDIEDAPDPGRDADLAAFLQLTVDNIADITKSDWDVDGGATGVDITAGFCDTRLSPGAVPVSQASHHLSVDGPGTLPKVTTLGAVFPDEAAAQDYLSDRAGSATCGDWTTSDGILLEVTEPPSTPTLVGCRCQDVQLHRVDAYLPGSQVQAQYTIVVRQDRFVSMGFYTIEESVSTSPDALRMVAALQDRLVERVNEIATTA